MFYLDYSSKVQQSMNFDPESGEGRSYPLAASAAQSPVWLLLIVIGIS
jgi:hypothetical protein